MKKQCFAIIGAKGRMGQAIHTILAKNDSLTLLGFDQEDVLDFSNVDAVIDFSTPTSSLKTLEACAHEGLSRAKPLVHVIGTTGFQPDQESYITALSDQVTVIKSGNFSLGINILTGLLKQVAALLPEGEFDIDILEAHHRHKRDAPSGTALMLADACALGRGQLPETLFSRTDESRNGLREEGKIGFGVIRAGGIIGEHSAIFASDSEIITLSHSARDRSLFASGAVRAAFWGLTHAQSGLYDMQNVLGFRV